MTRRKRITLELLGPPLLGAILLVAYVAAQIVWSVLRTGQFPPGRPEFFQFMGMAVLFAYAFAGLPSIFYAFTMEWRFARGLKPQSWSTVWLSGFLGFLSGLAMVMVNTREPAALAIGGGFGMVVGLLLGSLIKCWSMPKRVRMGELV